MHFNRALLLLPLLAACATPEQYPSLALREAERATGTFQPAVSEPDAPLPPSSVVTDRLAQLTAEAASAHRAFLAAAPQARSAVSAASGSEAGDEAWAQAQLALAALQSARGPAAIALADLDRLYLDAAVEGAATDHIAAARDAVAAQVAEQDTAIAALSGALR
jgi:hypothetical protein